MSLMFIPFLFCAHAWHQYKKRKIYFKRLECPSCVCLKFLNLSYNKKQGEAATKKKLIVWLFDLGGKRVSLLFSSLAQHVLLLILWGKIIILFFLKLFVFLVSLWPNKTSHESCKNCSAQQATVDPLTKKTRLIYYYVTANSLELLLG